MAHSMSTSPGSPAPVKEGDVLASKYRVEKVLGVGGMGVVVAAHHLELDQRVALKFLLPQAASNVELVERFLREARASVRLKGAHVAKTLDVGRLEDNCPYIVMEFLEGNDLHAELRSANGPLPIELAASYVLQAAEGLAEAHSRGIVHRDLKPGNLFLTRGVDGRPLVKVLDFGISKTLDTGVGGEGLALTKTEMLLGSPLYMSPEQMRSSKHVDERSDLWGLGAIAYELLTGKVPFEADTILELCFKVAQERPPSPKTHRPEVPEELCLAVLKCLEKDPEDRFANVGELARAFEPFGLARDRGTAERSLDVLGTGKRPPMRTAAPPAPIPATPLPATPLPVDAVSASSSPEPVAPAAWGTTQAQMPAKSRKGVFAIAAAVVVVGGVFAGVAASRKSTVEGGVASATSAVSGAKMEAEAKAEADAKVRAKAEAEADAKAKAEVDAKAKAEALVAAGSVDAGVAPIAVAAPTRRPLVKTTPIVSAKPAASTAAPDPGGFIKVRE
jgi:eukaryotic-like serine/threonine-protein kinase